MKLRLFCALLIASAIPFAALAQGKDAAGATVTINGKGEARNVAIDPKLMAPGEQAVVEDLVRAAINDAKGKLEQLVRDKMSELSGGLPLPPGLQLPF